jgi:hypothetical protein
MLKENLVDLLINLEMRFGGYVASLPRRKVSPHDPRPAEKIKKGGMIGGDRMSPDHHNYAPAYAHHLVKKLAENRPLVLLEFGVLRGTGLAMWAELLPAGSRIIGFDVDLSHFQDAREKLEAAGAFEKNPVEVYEYDQFVDSAAWLGDILGDDRVDIVIDDGCHFTDAILETALSVWPWLASGFVYFVEDNQPSADKLRRYFPKNSVSVENDLVVISGQTFQEWIDAATGYHVNYQHPRTWNEKINHKKIFDRNPLLPLTADKFHSRRWVADTLGTEDVLKPLLYTIGKPGQSDIWPWDRLPEKYVVKPNHLSGQVLFVDRDTPRQDIIDRCCQWMDMVYAPFSMEWNYREIEPCIVIEAMLDGKPDSYKFNMIHGKCVSIKHIIGGKKKADRAITYYDADWDKIEAVMDGYPHKVVPRPAQFEQMLEYAEQLSAPFDFVRVDFALHDGHIYFEEMTHYPVGGHATWDPVAIDHQWGDLWTDARNYWEGD